jgi:hypothetical protein
LKYSPEVSSSNLPELGSAPVILLEHLQSLHPQLVNLKFADAQPAYGRLADDQPADRHGTDR